MAAAWTFLPTKKASALHHVMSNSHVCCCFLLLSPVLLQQLLRLPSTEPTACTTR